MYEDELNAVTSDYIIRRPIDVFFRDNILLYILMSNGGMEGNIAQPSDLIDGGKKIKFMLEHGEGNSGTYGNDTVIPQSKKEIIGSGAFRWAGYYASNAIDLNDKLMNSGLPAIVNLAFAKLRNIEKTIRKKMGPDVYASASDTKAFLGLGNLFETTSGTEYGQISTDDVALWKANVDTTSEAIGFKVMQSIRRAAKVGQNNEDKPNLYITTELLKDGYERTLQAQQRFYSDPLVKAGFDHIMFSQAPMVADDNQGAGICDGLNTKHLNIKTHKDFAFTNPEWISLKTKGQPNTYFADSEFIGQLICTHRDAQARHSGLTEPL